MLLLFVVKCEIGCLKDKPQSQKVSLFVCLFVFGCVFFFFFVCVCLFAFCLFVFFLFCFWFVCFWVFFLDIFGWSIVTPKRDLIRIDVNLYFNQLGLNKYERTLLQPLKWIGALFSQYLCYIQFERRLLDK